MTEALTPQTGQLIAEQSAAGVKIQSVEGLSVLVLPNGYKHIDLTSAFEKLQETPDRKTGTANLASAASLVVYAKDQGRTDTGYAYADVDARTITMVFNDFKRAGSIEAKGLTTGAGWRDHRATFKAELTPEAKKWMEHDGSGRAFAQEEFAEFIEDNYGDLAGEQAANLLDVATTIAAKSDINFSSSKRLDNGQTQFVYNEVINATAGATGSATIPQKFTLGLRIFKGDPAGYAVTARLKYRLHSGRIKFWYELERIERVLEDAFLGYVKQVEEAGYTVLMGKPGA